MKKRNFEETLLTRANHLMEEFTELGKLAKRMKETGATEDEMHANHMNMADLAEELLQLQSVLKDYELDWIDDERMPALWRALVGYKRQQGL